MGRPKGMKRIDGVWYLPNGNVAPSSAAKANGRISTPKPAIVAQKPAETVTGSAERRTGTKIHTWAQIEDIQDKTGLVMIGNFSDNVGILVPVFVNPNRNEDWRNEHLTKIRRGV